MQDESVRLNARLHGGRRGGALALAAVVREEQGAATEAAAEADGAPLRHSVHAKQGVQGGVAGNG